MLLGSSFWRWTVIFIDFEWLKQFKSSMLHFLNINYQIKANASGQVVINERLYVSWIQRHHDCISVALQRNSPLHCTLLSRFWGDLLCIPSREVIHLMLYIEDQACSLLSCMKNLPPAPLKPKSTFHRVVYDENYIPLPFDYHFCTCIQLQRACGISV